ncbi:cellulase-domain-containing protein [Sistotremastrum suecicum HHB10207 ss-3]|uniref:cellulase n=1 Tax=Sistotremastrum suecicum HHB10207 ss-3 TaxID=1314776 RepID=A0A166C8W6_9AGAM|nr:cellulase-domain-containing protein [Sistotremastrum suecicum HHB10207 ss-3]
MLKALVPLVFLAAFVRSQAEEWQQCGGINWSGATTCVSGTVCTEQNPYYSQCLPGTATTTTTTTSTSTSTSSTATSSATSTPYTGSFLGGVNLSGFDFTVATNGSFSPPDAPPPTSQIGHFVAEGVNIFRVPTAWQLATPTLGGSLDQGWLSQYDEVVNTALQAGAHVIVDIHNYARWNGNLIGEAGGPTNEQFANLWSQLAEHYASEPNIIFGVMNEPHDLLSLQDWADSVQAAVTAIREAGATSQLILIPGSSYASAQQLPTEAGPYLLNVVDHDGTVGKLIFDVHKYLDSDNSGTHADCVTDNTAVLQTLVDWLQENGNRQALLSETGGGNTSSCETDLNSELAFVKAHSSSIIGFCVWAAGSFDTTYVLSVTPNPDGTDQPLWVDAVQPNLP